MLAALLAVAAFQVLTDRTILPSGRWSAWLDSPGGDLDADGRVRAVRQGFSGPATGAQHARLRADFERRIEELLAEAK